MPNSILSFRDHSLRVLSLLLLVAAACVAGGQASLAQTAAAAPGSQEAPRILVLGDSLSAEYGLERGTGWVQLLQERLQEENAPHRIVNASISGETTAGGASRLPELLAEHQPQIVILELGGNDALRGMPPSLTEGNLREMAERSREAGAEVVIVGMQIPPNYGRAYTERFRAVFEKVATEQEAALVPFLLEGIATDPAMFQADRIHPTAEAQPVLLENVWPVLQPLVRRTASASGSTTGASPQHGGA